MLEKFTNVKKIINYGGWPRALRLATAATEKTRQLMCAGRRGPVEWGSCGGAGRRWAGSRFSFRSESFHSLFFKS